MNAFKSETPPSPSYAFVHDDIGGSPDHNIHQPGLAWPS